MMEESEREKYRLHAKLPVFKRRIEKTQQIIERAMAMIKNPYTAISFGKDSMVLMHLLIQHNPNMPMVWSDRGAEAELPATYPFIERVRDRYNLNLRIIKPEMSMFEIYRQYGLPEIDEGITKAIVKEINLVRTFARYVQENGVDGYFQGLRADESRGRLMFAKNYGVMFKRSKDNLVVCNPLLWWTARDIWAYIVINDIPYHPEYDNNKFRDREFLRLSNWSGLYWAQEGRIAELKYYHPELFEIFASKFPEVKQFV